ncbi:MAG: DAK2 domain-containing protein [Evtepia gabavorous]
MLTVSRLAGTGPGGGGNTAFEYVPGSALERAREALADTVNQNPAEKGRGGGRRRHGLCGDPPGNAGRTPRNPGPCRRPGALARPQREKADFGGFETGEIQFGYCTEFICSRDTQKDPEALRAFLNGLGDSLVLVDDDEIIKVHVHTNHPGKVLEEALTYGGLLTVKVENMRQQHTELLQQEGETAPRQSLPPEKKYGFVAVAAGEGLAKVFFDLGVDGVIQGGQTMNPSTEDILKEIQKTPAEIVYVLPNNKNIILAAQQCVDLVEDKKVVVLQAKTVPQGISAMIAMNPDGEEAENTAAMEEAMGQVTTMEITYAARDSSFDGNAIQAGDYLLLVDNQLFGTEKSMETALEKLAQESQERGGEFISIFYGEGVQQGEAEQALAQFEAACPEAEITLLEGGQPVYHYLISVE